MEASKRGRVSLLFEHAPHGAAAAAIAVGALVLLGWVFDVAPLKSVFSGLVVMKANTALGFILAGVSLWAATVSRAPGRLPLAISRFCGGAVLLLGLLSLAEYLAGADFGIDQLLIREVTTLPGDIPGRMAVSTAVCFSCLGGALPLLSREKRGVVLAVHALVTVPILIGIAALVSYGYDIEAFLRVKLNYIPMALHTAAVFVVIGLGVISARPEFPFRRIMTSDSVAGSTARRLLPAAVGFQVAMGWLLLEGLQAAYFGEAVGLALFAMANVGGLGALILWNAALLHQAEAQRTRAEQALRKSAEEIEDLYNRAPIGYHSLDSDGKFVRINDTELAWLGYTRDEVVGRMSIADLLTPAGLQTFAENYPLFKARGWVRDLEFDLVRKDGTMLPILLSSTAIKDAQGNFVMSRSSVYDATERKQATDALRESEERFHAIFDWVNDAIFIHDKATGGILDVNRRVCEMYGYSREEALKLDVEALSAGVPPYTQQDALQWLEKAAHGEPQTFEWLAKDKAGRRFWVEVAIRHATLAGQDRLLVSVRDIGERKRAEEVLRESERYTRHLLSELPTAVVVHGPDTTIRYGNATALRLLGLTEDQLLGKTAYDPHWRFLRGDGSTMPPEEYPVNRVIAERRPLRGYLVGVVHGIGAEPVWVYVSAFPTMDSQGELREVVVAFVDITERKRAEEELRALQAQLREQAIRDSLTGLYNRRYLEETLQRELARAKREVHPLSVIMVDIDYFKRLNDTYGHAAGDEVLRTLGRLLQHHARSSDVPCRYGGEEFIVVLPDMPPEAARERAEEIRRDFLDLRIAFAGAELVASLSIGVSGYPAGGKTGDELIRAADQALYEAKQGGRNRVCCARASNG